MTVLPSGSVMETSLPPPYEAKLLRALSSRELSSSSGSSTELAMESLHPPPSRRTESGLILRGLVLDELVRDAGQTLKVVDVDWGNRRGVADQAERGSGANVTGHAQTIGSSTNTP